MHALITADPLGGVWTYVRELVTGLVRRGVRVTLVSFGRIPGPEQTRWLEELQGVDFRATGFRLEWMQEAESDFDLSSEYLASLVRELRPDIVHLNQFGYGAMDLGVPTVLVAHSDVVSWWVAVHGTEPPDHSWIRWYRDVVLKGLQGATVVVAPSQTMLDCIFTYYTRPARAKVIYNGRTPTLFNPYVSKQDYAVAVGRLWDEGKQISLVTRISSPIPVYLVGPDVHPDDIHGRRIAREWQSTVRFRGEMSEGELRQLYTRAALYIATSRYEPFGLAPLEAALSRCALVMNDIPSFRELWGEHACYFGRNDAVSLAETVAALVADRARCLAYANRAYEHARSRYGAQRMVDEYLGLYGSLLRMEASAA